MDAQRTPSSTEKQAATPPTTGGSVPPTAHRYQLPIVRELPLWLARVDDHDGW
jgi:hypothetical protein